MGKLTTHVLDTYHGLPAEKMTIELWSIAKDGTRILLTTVQTGKDGRTPSPLIEGEAMHIGEYELVFHVREYFQAKIGTVNASPFLHSVPVRFTLSNAIENYHVPLVTSPWAYSTYRGS